MTDLDRLDALAGTVSQAIHPSETEDDCEAHKALRGLVAAVRERDELREAAERLPRYAMVGALNERRMEPTPDGNFVLLSDLRAALHREDGTSRA